MEATDYVCFKTALALKKCGFDEPCDHIYLRDRNTDKWEFADWNVDEKDYNKRTRPQLAISAPALWQAAKWLREAKGIAINVDAHDGDFYTWDGIFLSNATQDVLVKLTFNVGFPSDAKKFLSYEEALSKGIAEALKLLENENK